MEPTDDKPAEEEEAADAPASEAAADSEPEPADGSDATAPAAAATPEETADKTAAPGAAAPLPSAPERHSGDRIASRYRLEECITQAGVFSSWRATDEKLRRAVGVHLLSAGHPRAKATLAAARQAALLGDPRFVQVLDAVEDGGIVYIVREWLPDATGLDKLLLEEPLEAYDAYQLVRQLADALAAAHRRGLAHLRLTPASVLRTDSGQYRIDGIAVNAALRGLDPEDSADAALQDTRAIGTLLFAALTHRWPYPEDRYGLQGLPRSLGTVPAERVRAGVNRGLSDLTARTLCAEPGGKLEPITTPQDLAKAVAALPKVRQPAPEPLVLPSYPTHRPAGQQPAASAGAASGPHGGAHGGPGGPTATAARPLPPALPGRSGKALKWVVSLVVLGAIGLGSWGTAEALMSPTNPSTGNTQLDQGTTGHHPGDGGASHPALKRLTIAGATEFSPLAEAIAGNQASLAADGNPTTAWTTSSYQGYANFGNLPPRKDGSGILVDLGSVQSVSEVKVTIPTSGQTMEILAAPGDASGATPPADLGGFSQRISNSGLLSGTALDSGVLATPVKTRYILVHVTSLPPDPTEAGHFRGGISEIQVFG
ncbi:protein kinase family protein [Streptacidiphilus rugosus]|uniref:protein kinase family protein n=1 Tax=Streptacidiphilus rugosus TaxID=405783 RepID=UPI00056BB69E